MNVSQRGEVDGSGELAFNLDVIRVGLISITVYECVSQMSKRTATYYATRMYPTATTVIFSP